MFEGAELPRRVSRENYEREVPRLREALLDAQDRLANAGFSVVIVVAGAEGTGKGETVNTLLEWLDARGVEAHGLGAPSAEEAERPNFRCRPMASTSKSSPCVASCSIKNEEMVGTALNQVQRCSEIQPQNREMLRRWGITTLPPLANGAIKVTISPLMW